jgi:hypothetical protein
VVLSQSFLADGAYDGDPTSDLLVDRFGEAIEIVIPPPITAVLSLDAARDQTPRDKHIAEIRDKGRLACDLPPETSLTLM